MFDGREVGRGVLGEAAALVTAEHPVHDPVQAVFDGSMTADGRPLYARPSNSEPGRTWLISLPHVLNGSNPRDPVNDHIPDHQTALPFRAGEPLKVNGGQT